MASYILNSIWMGIAVGVVLLALAFAPRLSSFLETRRRRKLGNHFVGEGRQQPREVPPDSTPQAVPMATYAEVKREYERRHQYWQKSTNEVLTRLRLLDRLDYRQMDVVNVLAHATGEERGNLAVILGIGAGAGPTTLVEALRKAGSHGLMSVVRGGHVPYEEVVKDVARKLGG